jgi:hypothetical protein
MDLNRIDEYINEGANKDEFYAWARERQGQTLTATIVQGGLVLAVCKGKFQMARSPIPDWRVNGKSADITFPFASFKANPVKIMGKEGWRLDASSIALTYELY